MHQQGGTLAATDITIHRGADAILERVSLAVTPGSRIGVVGPNGRGKTTLLRALAGLEPLDGGSITRNPPSLRVGYLPQERDLAPEETLASYLARRTGVGEVEAKLAALESALESDPHAAEAHAETLERFLALGGADFEARARGVLADVGLDAPLDRPAGALSGGEKGRAALASILLARFDVFLLDEPTNDLDFAGLDLLERFLLAVEGGVVLVSHDRALLDRTVNRIVELESGTQRVHHYAGGWSEFEAAREHGRAEHERAFANWSEERGRFTRLHRDRREQARVGGKQANRRGTHALMSKTRAAARRVEWLERDRVEKPWQPWELQLDLAPEGRSGDLVVSLDRAVLERGSFRLGPIDVNVGWGERISITGPNGAGKTTLLDGLLGRLAAHGGDAAGRPGRRLRRDRPGAGPLPAGRAAARLVLRGGRNPRGARPERSWRSSTSTRATSSDRPEASRPVSGRVRSSRFRPRAEPAASSSTSRRTTSTCRRSRSSSERSARTTGR